MSDTYHDGVDVSHKLSKLVIDADLDMGNRNISIGGNLKLLSSSLIVWNEELALYRAASDQVGISDYPQTVNKRLVCSDINSIGTMYWMALAECGITDDTPASPTEGDIKLDSVNHRLQFYNASAWKTLSEDP